MGRGSATRSAQSGGAHAEPCSHTRPRPPRSLPLRTTTHPDAAAPHGPRSQRTDGRLDRRLPPADRRRRARCRSLPGGGGVGPAARVRNAARLQRRGGRLRLPLHCPWIVGSEFGGGGGFAPAGCSVCIAPSCTQYSFFWKELSALLFGFNGIFMGAWPSLGPFGAWPQGA